MATSLGLLADRFPAEGTPRLVLAVVFFTQLVWCLDYHERRWTRKGLAELVRPSEVGEGLIIQRNGLGYYAWLRSPLVDRDWSFDNEFDRHNLLNDYVPPETYRTPIGRRANQWSVGPACLWAPVVALGHAVLSLGAGRGSPWAANGYSLPYQLMVGGTSLAYSLLGLGLIYGLCRRYARPARAALATASLVLGTTIFYYSSIEVSLPHGLGVTALSGLTWYWLTTYGTLRKGRWFLVGLLLGAAALVRWQLATFAVLPAGEAAIRVAPGGWGRLRQRLGQVTPCLALAALGGLLAFLPQLVAWRCVYGTWLVVPIYNIKYHYITPSLLDILFSRDRGLCYWTPTALLALLAGLAGLGRAQPARPVSPAATAGPPLSAPRSLLWAAFLVQVLFLGGMWGKGEWVPSAGNYAGVFLARSFGFRDLTESLIVLAPGLAWSLERLGPKAFQGAAVVVLALAAWNLTLVNLYTNDLIPQDSGLGPAQLLAKAGEMIARDPVVFLHIMEGPLLIGVAVGWAKGGVASAGGSSGKRPDTG